MTMGQARSEDVAGDDDDDRALTVSHRRRRGTGLVLVVPMTGVSRRLAPGEAGLGRTYYELRVEFTDEGTDDGRTRGSVLPALLASRINQSKRQRWQAILAVLGLLLCLSRLV